MKSLLLFWANTYLYIFFRNPLNLCKACTKVFSGIFGKRPEHCGLSDFMGKSWGVNSWKIKCGDVRICEIPTHFWPSDVLWDGVGKIAECFGAFRRVWDCMMIKVKSDLRPEDQQVCIA